MIFNDTVEAEILRSAVKSLETIAKTYKSDTNIKIITEINNLYSIYTLTPVIFEDTRERLLSQIYFLEKSIGLKDETLKE